MVLIRSHKCVVNIQCHATAMNNSTSSRWDHSNPTRKSVDLKPRVTMILLSTYLGRTARNRNGFFSISQPRSPWRRPRGTTAAVGTSRAAAYFLGGLVGTRKSEFPNSFSPRGCRTPHVNSGRASPAALARPARPHRCASRDPCRATGRVWCGFLRTAPASPPCRTSRRDTRPPVYVATAPSVRPSAPPPPPGLFHSLLLTAPLLRAARYTTLKESATTPWFRASGLGSRGPGQFIPVTVPVPYAYPSRQSVLSTYRPRYLGQSCRDRIVVHCRPVTAARTLPSSLAFRISVLIFQIFRLTSVCFIFESRSIPTHRRLFFPYKRGPSHTRSSHYTRTHVPTRVEMARINVDKVRYPVFSIILFYRLVILLRRRA